MILKRFDKSILKEKDVNMMVLFLKFIKLEINV